MKALINNPKRTGTICFITLILTMVADIVYQYGVYSIGLTNKINLTSLLLKDFLSSRFTFLLTRQILFGRLFLILYLGLVLFKKNKSMKALNIMAIIQLVIFGVNELKQIFDVINYYDNMISAILNGWNVCFYLISIVVMVYLMVNIVLKKKINYKLYSLIVGIMLMIVFVVGLFNRPTLLANTIYNILESISYLTILIFIYSYGKSINKRSGNDE